MRVGAVTSGMQPSPELQLDREGVGVTNACPPLLPLPNMLVPLSPWPTQPEIRGQESQGGTGHGDRAGREWIRERRGRTEKKNSPSVVSRKPKRRVFGGTGSDPERLAQLRGQQSEDHVSLLG